MGKIINRNILVNTACYVLFIFAFFMISCSAPDSRKDDLITIDLYKVIHKECDVPISQFVDSLEYILLELTPESGIKYISKLYLTDKYIIVRDGILLLLFDRESGKFIRQLGKPGRGPEEYTMPLDCFYNLYDKKIYTYGYMRSSIKTYNLDGKFLGSFATPVCNEAANMNLPINAFLDSVTCAGYIENSTGQNTKRLVIFSKDQEFKSFPNYEKWSSEYVTIYQNPIFFSWRGHLSFKETSNDTIFSINNAGLSPQLVLFSEDFRHPNKLSREEAIEQLSKPKDYFETFNIFENSKYLFFDLISKKKPSMNNPKEFKLVRNLCIYDKIKNRTYVCKNNNETINSCLTDDINNFMPIAPISITGNNELVAFLQAMEIVKWRTENQEHLGNIKAKIPWLERINEYDNPVIVVARFKE